MAPEENPSPTESTPPPPEAAPPGAESKASVQERLDRALHEAARKLEETAEQFERLGSQGTKASEYSQKVASQLRTGARYLEGAEVDDLLERTRSTVRRYPVASLGIAFGVGFVLARLLKR
ncbi:hypothetical protein [Gloeobacter violaceus]|nr:hypothetical protein [Gloeobacter violaceus]